MSDEVIVENSLNIDGIRRVHVMSNSPIANPSPRWGDGKVVQEAGVFHVRIQAPARGVIHIELEGGAKRLAVLWSVEGYPNMRAAIKDAILHFQEHCGGLQADFIYMAKLPNGIENGFEVADAMLFKAEWMMPGFVLVCSAQHYLD